MTRNPQDICSVAKTSSPEVRAHGGGHTSPAAPNAVSFLAGLRDSVWAPIVLKAGGGCIALCALGLLGAASLHARPGVAIAPVGSEWVAAADVPPVPSAASSAALPRAGSRGEQAEATEPNTVPGAQLPPCVPGSTAASTASSAPAGGSAPSSATSGVTADGRVILNVATQDELRRLPGIGPSKAEAIVELRTRLKKFRRVTELLRVRGIGPKSLKRLEPLVVLDPPTPPSADAAGAVTGAAKP